jgi:hypothetical protein
MIPEYFSTIIEADRLINFIPFRRSYALNGYPSPLSSIKE